MSYFTFLIKNKIAIAAIVPIESITHIHSAPWTGRESVLISCFS